MKRSMAPKEKLRHHKLNGGHVDRGTWLILVAQIATKKPKLVPSGLQNFVEWIVESLIGFFEGILGAKLARETFWFFGTIFIFILFSNWFGLIPGVGTVGWTNGRLRSFSHASPGCTPVSRC